MNWVKSNSKKTYIILIVMLIAFYRFHGDSTAFPANTCDTPMVWKHAVGTIDKLQVAEKEHYCGVEVDVLWSPKGYFIAEYTDPLKENAPKLSELFITFPEIKYWWLDVKNLNRDNAKLLSKGLETLLKQTSGHIIIESHDILGLVSLTRNNRVYKSYWLAKNEGWVGFIPYRLRSIFAMLIINPDFVSMFYYQVGENDYGWVGSRTRLAFTVNEIKTAKHLFANDIAVVLTDSLKPEAVRSY